MASYFVQTMRSGVLPSIEYYRKQKNDHPDHKESSAFTTAAKNAYANANGILPGAVELGPYQSGQGVPNNPNAVNI